MRLDIDAMTRLGVQTAPYEVPSIAFRPALRPLVPKVLSPSKCGQGSICRIIGVLRLHGGVHRGFPCDPVMETSERRDDPERAIFSCPKHEGNRGLHRG